MLVPTFLKLWISHVHIITSSDLDATAALVARPVVLPRVGCVGSRVHTAAASRLVGQDGSRTQASFHPRSLQAVPVACLLPASSFLCRRVGGGFERP